MEIKTPTLAYNKIWRKEVIRNGNKNSPMDWLASVVHDSAQCSGTNGNHDCMALARVNGGRAYDL